MAGCNVVVFILCVYGYVSRIDAQTNLLQNGDFENTNYAGNWYCQSCTMAPSNDAYHGSHSVKISNRHQNWNGLAQNLNLHATSIYTITAYIKLLTSTNNAQYQEMIMMLNCIDSSGAQKYMKFGEIHYMEKGKWYQVGGADKIPSGYHGCHMYVQTAAPADYLVDEAEVHLNPVLSNWRSDANARIDTYRKADLTVRLTGNNVNAASVQIEV
ncbi:hypothetical protein MAR_026435 [Mya arenaria]|uniref:endo-1,4-beta-xylanase n=1 Tax=Mya arenaria TaxID=6604 RepID=A0ABY7EQY0_MYAAR|nr:hypothetical protein MAR_026435 [Mya arenaria]